MAQIGPDRVALSTYNRGGASDFFASETKHRFLRGQPGSSSSLISGSGCAVVRGADDVPLTHLPAIFLLHALFWSSLPMAPPASSTLRALFVFSMVSYHQMTPHVPGLVDVIINLVLHLSRSQQVKEKDRCPIISMYECHPLNVSVGHCSSAELNASREAFFSMSTMHTHTLIIKQWQPSTGPVALIVLALACGSRLPYLTP